MARHTFATLFLSEGVPLESLRKMLEHKNIATTQIYAKILNEKVGKDMQKVSKNLREWSSLFFRNYDNINKTNQKQSYIIICIFVG